MTHNRIKSVKPLPGMRLLVEFRDGTVKECNFVIYLDRWDALKPLLEGLCKALHNPYIGYLTSLFVRMTVASARTTGPTTLPSCGA